MQWIAHINKNGIQTVKEHCENTAKYAAESGALFSMEKLLYLTGLMHDVGKSTEAFREYIQKAASGDESVRRGEVNHSSCGARYITSFRDNCSSVAVELMSYTICAHHGVIDELTPYGEDILTKRIDRPARDTHYEEALENSEDWLGQRVVEEYLNSIEIETRNMLSRLREIADDMSDNKKIRVESMLCLISVLQRLVLSCLVDADRRDTYEFMSSSSRHSYSDAELCGLWDEYGEKIEARVSSFKDGPSTEIGMLRNELSDQCADFAKNGDGIYRLSIPTGGGKTISSMRYAVKLAKETGKKHVIYVAPFLSILEQNADEYRRIFDDDENILEHHSNVVIDDDDDAGQDRLSYRELLAEDWSAPVILTTMVRLMNVLYGRNMQDIRRMHALCDSVIIIDEAQSIPVRTIDLMNTAFNFLTGVCGSTIVLCTATQPLFEMTRHKLLLSEDADMIKNQEKYNKGFTRVEVIDAITDAGFNTEELAGFIREKLGRSMLVILNTKNAVRNVYDSIKNNIPEDVALFQLTTYMCAQHRTDVIDNIKEFLRQGKRVLCVSTQLIEAGVDISFESVIRSAAGLDSIAQAAGRCNRGGEMKNGLGKVYIVKYNDEKLGKLDDIKMAREAFYGVCDTYDGKLLSKEAMDLFYERYFYSRFDETEYNVRDLDTTIYELLACNSKSLSAYAHTEKADTYPFPMAESFKTAYSSFMPIEDTDQISLIVPYGRATEYIEMLRKSFYIADQRKILRKLQRYSININKNSLLMSSLKDRHAIDDSILDGSVLVLETDYYQDIGVTDELSFQCY
jgi:CRISPR-associated endonuclease/helicase Cas3